MNDFISWFVGDSATVVFARAGLAVLVLAVMAGVDIARRGREATRWKEYLFLLAATAAAVAFAIAHDQVTASVSPLYFESHPGAHASTENVSQPNSPIRLLAVGMAARGSWWVGLVLGMLLLMMNNPRKTLPRLPWRRMYVKLLYPTVLAAVGSSVLGLLSWAGLLWLPGDLNRNWDDARQFNAVFAAHNGAYFGGVLGAIIAAVQVIRQRKQARSQAQPPVS